MTLGTHAQFIRHCLHLAELAGADPMIMERELGLELREAGENGWVDTEVCFRKVKLLRDLLGTESPPFLLVKNFSMSSFGVAGYVILNSPNGETAFRKYVEYQHLFSDLCKHEVHKTDQGLELRMTFNQEWRDEFQFMVEFTFLGFLLQVMASLGREVHPISASFVYPTPAEIDRYREFFKGTELKFSAEKNSVVYPLWLAESKLVSANPGLFKVFDELAQEALAEKTSKETFSSKVRAILVHEIRGGLPAIGLVADKLKISPRTLQQKLSAENTTYREIADEVRRDLAVVHLRRRALNFSEIAYLLGFSEVSAFSNAFKKWTGLAPSAYALRQV